MLLLFACAGTPLDASVDSSADPDTDADTDADADSDTDADTDADSDSDSDSDTSKPSGHVLVAMDTSLGALRLDLDGDAAPVTAANFLQYVDGGFFDGADGFGATVFHRVVAGFVVQGGGYTADGAEKTTHPPIELEETGLSNLRGTLAMARKSRPDSATSQFYVNLVDNTFLDGTGNDDGYAVFGAVTAGMSVVDAIAALPVDGVDAPLDDVLITRCVRE